MKRTSQSDYDLNKVSDRYKYVDAINKRIKRFYTIYGVDYEQSLSIIDEIRRRSRYEENKSE